MLELSSIRLAALATHYVGNQAAGDVLQLSEEPVDIQRTDLRQLLLQFFLQPFQEAPSYHLYHPTDLALNTIVHHAAAIFENHDSLLQHSQHLARHLHDITTLPQVKSGELHVALFTGVPVQGRMTDALAIVKTESKQRYLKISDDEQGRYAFDTDEGVNPEKMDKGCLIFNTQAEEGYLVHVTDRTAKGSEAQFWKDTFLKVLAAQDEYHQTEDMIRMTRVFIEEQVPAEYQVDRADQAAMLNRTAGYFKANDQYSQAEFEEEVFGDPGMVQSFRQFREGYQQERDLKLEDEFEISDAAVKKNQRAFKSVLKLDKNFHIYIHGDRERMERGFDEETGLNYYKVYFEEES